MKTARKSTSAAKTPSKPKKKSTSVNKPVRKHTQAAAQAPEPEITEVEIATCAYFIYISEGCPAGRELDHWLEAEARLKNR
ncbi:MAG: DUF2934 domain-containing protein [Verrucomicrobiaceae bacterium]|nr:DUF2934 domain-containing protein [Verrucomicrobiaceae bacterium]